ncbi:MAG: hypothetical protein HKN13_10075 [Rhodothermales bacterium]|nr:hypothetical protein [Rhodothermales bacterium]
MKGPVTALLLSFLGLLLLAWMASGTIGQKLEERSDGLSQISQEHKRRSVIANFPGVDPTWKKQIPELLAPQVSVEPVGGFESRGAVLSLAADGDPAIRYTLDGSTPDRFSSLYVTPIELDSTLVVRARTFVNGKFPGDIATNTYVVDSRHRLPVVAITTDPENLWNKYSGMYEKFDKRGRSWRRKAVVEYLPVSGESRLSVVADLRIHGGWSRQLPKKSFHLYFDRAAFTGDAQSSVLSAVGTVPKREAVIRSGGHLPNVRLNDALYHETYRALGHPTGAIEPVAVYLNGDYFGAYNLRETIDADYAERHYGYKNPDVVEVDNCWLGTFTYFYPCFYPVAGDDRAWLDLVRFFNAADLSKPDEFERASALIDLDNFTDYWIINVFLANLDWPEANGYMMRNRDGADTRWRWVPWDADQSFASFGDTSAVVNNLARTTIQQTPPKKPWVPMDGYTATDIHSSNWKGTLFARKLLENDTFRARFVRRYSDLLNSTFSVAQMDHRLDSLLVLYSSEVERDLSRWNKPPGYFDEKLRLVRDFIEQRPDYAWEHLQDRFDLDDRVSLSVRTTPVGAGSVELNSLALPEGRFDGDYFPETTLELSARPNEGFEFDRWVFDSDRPGDTNPRTELRLLKASTVRAAFRSTR